MLTSTGLTELTKLAGLGLEVTKLTEVTRVDKVDRVDRVTWLQCHFLERNIPHPNQTAYRKGVSCAEAIFSTMEVISTYSRCSEKVYMCFYDLQKAFDSIQYPVLLKRLYESGVNGKAWRIIRSWYTSPKSMMRVNEVLSSPFTLEHGVLQGSILSPVLFLLIMDPLLKSLQSNGLGLSVGDTCRRLHPC